MGLECELVALLSELRDHLGFRRIEAGMRLLERKRPLLESLSPESRNSGVLLGLVAQWVDAGFDSPALLCRLLSRFTRVSRTVLPLNDYLHVRMAEGVVAMSEEDFDCAAAHFRFVQSLENEVEDNELFAVANFWIGRSLRRVGQYDDALNYIRRGEELALSCGYREMAAIMQAALSWLAFQKGRYHDALELLARAEEALSRTDDFLSRGNIQSAYGRILRRQGRYERALDYFERAIAEYRSSGGGQTQLARALRNRAFVKRQLALQTQKQFDSVSASRRSGRGDSEPAQRSADQRLKIEEIRAAAAADLDEAMAIYARHHHHAGIAGVHINRAFLCLDSGDLECAAAESAEAFRYGAEKREYLVMARARTLQCTVEIAAVEEQLGDPGRHKEAAEAFARDA
ncbi:MAG TPA: tetratricopeptide repeat protein, partial [Bryobacteraceae bacterium]|nr:tetratricopeptide repeat protein [Bryobacteraceae bacterium]